MSSSSGPHFKTHFFIQIKFHIVMHSVHENISILSVDNNTEINEKEIVFLPFGKQSKAILLVG